MHVCVRFLLNKNHIINMWLLSSAWPLERDGGWRHDLSSETAGSDLRDRTWGCCFLTKSDPFTRLIDLDSWLVCNCAIFWPSPIQSTAVVTYGTGCRASQPQPQCATEWNLTRIDQMPLYIGTIFDGYFSNWWPTRTWTKFSAGAYFCSDRAFQQWIPSWSSGRWRPICDARRPTSWNSIGNLFFFTASWGVLEGVLIWCTHIHTQIEMMQSIWWVKNDWARLITIPYHKVWCMLPLS